MTEPTTNGEKKDIVDALLSTNTGNNQGDGTSTLTCEVVNRDLQELASDASKILQNLLQDLDQQKVTDMSQIFQDGITIAENLVYLLPSETMDADISFAENPTIGSTDNLQNIATVSLFATEDNNDSNIATKQQKLNEIIKNYNTDSETGILLDKLTILANQDDVIERTLTKIAIIATVILLVGSPLMHKLLSYIQKIQMKKAEQLAKQAQKIQMEEKAARRDKRQAQRVTKQLQKLEKYYSSSNSFGRLTSHDINKMMSCTNTREV